MLSVVSEMHPRSSSRPVFGSLAPAYAALVKGRPQTPETKFRVSGRLVVAAEADDGAGALGASLKSQRRARGAAEERSSNCKRSSAHAQGEPLVTIEELQEGEEPTTGLEVVRGRPCDPELEAPASPAQGAQTAGLGDREHSDARRRGAGGPAASPGAGAPHAERVSTPVRQESRSQARTPRPPTPPPPDLPRVHRPFSARRPSGPCPSEACAGGPQPSAPPHAAGGVTTAIDSGRRGSVACIVTHGPSQGRAAA
eukprot:tig00000808_g4396.t1